MNASKHGRPPALAEQIFISAAQRLRGKSHKEIFTYINETNLWGSPESRSGLGSEDKATRKIREEIPKLLVDFKIDSMLDLPCGDYGWVRAMALPISHYIGADVVASVVSKLNAENQHFDFRQLDLTADELPKTDLVLCRDCLVHFSFASIAKAIANLKRSGSRYLLTTTFTELAHTIDIQDGDWRPLNLEQAPFLFGKPLALINEGCTEVNGAYADKSLGLWEIQKIPIFSFEKK